MKEGVGGGVLGLEEGRRQLIWRQKGKYFPKQMCAGPGRDSGTQSRF